jgi:RTX calcium-binding nonapeptide repeat (4 copies)
MAISGDFSAGTGVLTETGDTQDNTIVTSRDAAGTILINGGTVPIQGGTATVANTNLIQAFGQSGNDTITLDETNGALPNASLFGGDGNDVLTGGSGADQVSGDSGNDILLGKGGNDVLFGGDGNDTLTGGTGNDQVFGQAGDDRMIWNPGDGSDLFEGGDGNDTAEVNGGDGTETFTITANGGRVRFDRVDPASFTLDIGTTENLVLNANGGDDIITAGRRYRGVQPDRHAAHRQWRRRRRHPDRQRGQRHPGRRRRRRRADRRRGDRRPRRRTGQQHRAQRRPGHSASGHRRLARPVHGVELRPCRRWPRSDADRRPGVEPAAVVDAAARVNAT